MFLEISHTSHKRQETRKRTDNAASVCQLAAPEAHNLTPSLLGDDIHCEQVMRQSPNGNL